MNSVKHLSRMRNRKFTLKKLKISKRLCTGLTHLLHTWMIRRKPKETQAYTQPGFFQTSAYNILPSLPKYMTV